MLPFVQQRHSHQKAYRINVRFKVTKGGSASKSRYEEKEGNEGRNIGRDGQTKIRLQLTCSNICIVAVAN